MKKKLICLVTMFAMSTTLLFGCGLMVDTGAGEETTTTEVELIDETNDETREALTVGFDASFPPYGYEDENGDYVGFDLDLAAEVAQRNGWELILQPIDWDAKDMELNAGTIDCIWNGFTINGREGQYEWTDAYVDNSQVVIVRADSGIASLEDLAGKEVIVQADSSALKALEKGQAELAATFGALTEVPEYNTAFMSLEAGAAEAVVLDIGIAKFQLESRGDAFIILDEIVAEEQYGIGTKLGNTLLRDQIQTTLYEMLEDGTFMEIAERWGLEDSVSLGQ